MNVFVRAVISGFGFSLGAALFKRVSDKIGLGEKTGADPVEARPDPDSTLEKGEQLEEDPA